MVWTWLRQQQQRGAQLPTSEDPRRAAGEAPAEAVAGREVQDHDYADLDLSPTGEPQRGIDYPATNPPERRGDATPSVPESQVDWDDVVQPERHSRQAETTDDLPLPEGK